MILIGDSLAVGMAPYMPARAVVDARVGRPTWEGLQRLSSHRRQHVLLVSLGTNDSPGSLGVLRKAIRQTRRWVGQNGCVVWSTVYRRGWDYSRWNATLLRHRGPHFKVVRWGGHYVGSDGVHSTPTGYKVRTRYYLNAVDRCR